MAERARNRNNNPKRGSERMKQKTLDKKWKKAVIQIAEEMRKANKITAIVGSGILGQELGKLKNKKEELKEMDNRRGIS